ncbi:hypothetical protein [Capnocytophaga sp.]|uniref:hypothetical protein n=1 Tax=Capnocytophaga sp. TaxID=44737 RepID=UPI0026DC76CD|nr:hypothetical protein [Capnocytophaga sp.]MDO5105956.1 hypothetical protein [Capnocytophaga sp.]
MGIENTTLGKILQHLYEHFLPYLNGFNTLLFAIIGILFELDFNKIGWIIFIIVVFLTIFQILEQVKYSKTVEKLEEEKNGEITQLKEEKGKIELKVQSLENQISKINNNSIDLVETYLANLSDKIKLGCDGRITLYKFINNEFYILGRFSENPELKKRSRVSYKQEGLIFKAWKEGKFFITKGIPSPTTVRGTFYQKYYKVLNKIAPIDKNTVISMSMKSRSFYLKALKDSTRTKNTSIIAIENLQENAFQENVINSTLNVEEEKKLTNFVEKIDWVFPNIDEARQKGF